MDQNLQNAIAEYRSVCNRLAEKRQTFDRRAGKLLCVALALTGGGFAAVLAFHLTHAWLGLFCLFGPIVVWCIAAHFMADPCLRLDRARIESAKRLAPLLHTALFAASGPDTADLLELLDIKIKDLSRDHAAATIIVTS